MVVITSDQRDVILDAVEAMYTAVAKRPGETFHFPTGRRACEYVGYPAEQLDRLPPTAVESFAGVGYPFAAGAIDEGDTVLDIGCGSGTDALLSALLAGPDGRVFGLDMTAAMREKCLANAERAGLSNVEVLDGNAEEIPLPDDCVDVVTTNGVINLVPEKEDAIREIHRVLVSGGRLQISDIVVRELPSKACRSEPELWAECIVGATTESSYREIFREAGFVDVERLAELDYFAASPDDSTREVAGGFGAHSITLRATKP
ncbi:MAG: methyltransferase domain-containing protein [Gemmatimonadota bacterium]